MKGLTLKKMHMAGLMAGALVVASAGWAQSALVPNALTEGSVGEQADGYMGFRAAPTDALRAEVDAINIKRRAVYTQLASQRGVTVKDVAATVGCETLKSRVAPGRAYLLPDGIWRVKGAEPITLPAYCGN
ncbi:MAG: YdbL family protein [Chakrabartia sp.]